MSLELYCLRLVARMRLTRSSKPACLQAERGRRDAEQQGAASRRQEAALRDQNAELQERLVAAQRQVHQLESLQPFADSWQEQQQRERELAAALEAASGRAAALEGRCRRLEQEVEETAAALQAAQQLVDSHDAQQQQQRQQRQQQRPAGSLSLSELADLDGTQSHLEGSASPQRSSGALPSRQWALQQRQATTQAAERQRRAADEEAAVANAEAAASTAQLGQMAELQRQLLEQQRQLAVLLDRQAEARCEPEALPMLPLQHGDGSRLAALQQQAAALEREVEKLKRRNTHLQTALAEASLQHARAAAAGQKQLHEAVCEAADIRQQRDEAAAQLAALQAAVAAFGASDGGGVAGGCSAEWLEQLHSELIQYASRCNFAVEQNAGLLQEKKAWLERLRAAEAEAERCRTEAQQLRLQHLQLQPAATGNTAAGGSELLGLLLEAQADEAALRGVLNEAREQQIAAAKGLSAELRRVHALERLRISKWE